MRKPLTMPTTAPHANTTMIARYQLKPTPEPPTTVSLMISQAPSIGARPTTDSSERSNLPAIKINDSAITSTDSSEDCCRM